MKFMKMSVLILSMEKVIAYIISCHSDLLIPYLQLLKFKMTLNSFVIIANHKKKQF